MADISTYNKVVRLLSQNSPFADSIHPFFIDICPLPSLLELTTPSRPLNGLSRHVSGDDDPSNKHNGGLDAIGIRVSFNLSPMPTSWFNHRQKHWWSNLAHRDVAIPLEAFTMIGTRNRIVCGHLVPWVGHYIPRNDALVLCQVLVGMSASRMAMPRQPDSSLCSGAMQISMPRSDMMSFCLMSDRPKDLQGQTRRQ